MQKKLKSIIPRILWYSVLLFLLFIVIIVIAMVSTYDVLDIVQTVEKMDEERSTRQAFMSKPT